MKGRMLAGLGVLLVAGAAASACGSGAGSSGDSAAESSVLARLSHAAAALTATGSTHRPTGTPTGTIRVVNLFADNGQAGGPMDLYDVFHPAAGDTPIIKDLAYGQVSQYVSPRAAGSGNPSQLFLYPAGTLTPSGAYDGGNVSNAGWEADEKLTLVIGPTAEGGSYSSKAISDGQSKEEPLPSQSAPAGQATLSTWNADEDLSDAPEAYLAVDGTCPSALDQSAGQPGMVGGLFAVPSGTHQLAVITSPRGSGLTSQQCATQAASATATVSVDAPAGGRVDVIAYGDSGGAMKVIAAPVS
jgi:hypothetical protein